eukprot:COSAG05_NODE_1286_length_5278_cov_4.428461_5_plen_88_part_00
MVYAVARRDIIVTTEALARHAHAAGIGAHLHPRQGVCLSLTTGQLCVCVCVYVCVYVCVCVCVCVLGVGCTLLIAFVEHEEARMTSP